MTDKLQAESWRTGIHTVKQDLTSLCVPMMIGLQGLITQIESEAERKLKKVCRTAKMYQDAAEKSMKAMTQIYGYNRRLMVNRYISELKFVDHAEGLARNLTSLRKRSARLSQQLDDLRRNAQKQMEDLYRTEVDIDMKLRACQGSCRFVVPFSVDHHSHQTLQAKKDLMEITLSQKRRSAKYHKDIPLIKLKPVTAVTATSVEYRSIPTVKTALLTEFEDIGQNRMVLEESAEMKGLE